MCWQNTDFYHTGYECQQASDYSINLIEKYQVYLRKIWDSIWKFMIHVSRESSYI